LFKIKTPTAIAARNASNAKMPLNSRIRRTVPRRRFEADSRLVSDVA
jgi:hypothetical protein